jgi:hypothetical protein
VIAVSKNHSYQSALVADWRIHGSENYSSGRQALLTNFTVRSINFRALKTML